MQSVTMSTGNGRPRLAGVDGLRAVAALWVVLFHVHAFSQVQVGRIPGLDLFLRSGSIGVSLFLVLSGFCLYIPFAGSRIGRFRTRSFLLRRCQRLLPAYYASLVLALLLALIGGPRLGYDQLSPAQAAWQFLTHATLTHPLSPSTFYGLNGAYWSLGLEWQLYLALPLLIVGVRRYGLGRTAALAIACNVVYRLALAGLVAHGAIARDSALAVTVLPNQLPGRWAEFVFGMIAAELYVAGRIAVLAGRLKWALLPLVPASLLLVNAPLSHLLFGGIFFILLSLVLAADNPVSRALSWPPLVTLGVMSYSVYLVHEPIIQGLGFVLRTHAHMSPTATFIALLLLLPAILAVAWLLFVSVERHSLSANQESLPRMLRGRRLPRIALGARRYGDIAAAPSGGTAD